MQFSMLMFFVYLTRWILFLQFGGASPCSIPGADGIVLYLQWDVFYRNMVLPHAFC